MPLPTQVHASDKNTYVGEVQAGLTYRIVAEGHWVDWFIKTDARGFRSPFYLLPFERRRRLPSANWFALVGFVARSPMSVRSELNLAEQELLDLSGYANDTRLWTCSRSGSLHVFANDLATAYWNNRGSISISVTVQAEPI